MTVLEFLNACQDRLAPNGEITVRASVNLFCCRKEMCPKCSDDPAKCCTPNNATQANFISMTKEMREAGDKLTVPWKTLGLDNW